MVRVRAPKVAAEDGRKVDVRKVERLEREVEAAGVERAGALLDQLADRRLLVSEWVSE